MILATVTNADNGSALNYDIAKWIMAEFFQIAFPQPEPIAYEPDAIKPYVGKYDRPFASIELGIIAGRLIGQAITKKGFPDEHTPVPPPPPPATLMPTGKNKFILIDGPAKDSEVEFLRKPDGSVGWLRLGLRVYRRLD